MWTGVHREAVHATACSSSSSSTHERWATQQLVCVLTKHNRHWAAVHKSVSEMLCADPLPVWFLDLAIVNECRHEPYTLSRHCSSVILKQRRADTA